MHGTRVTMEQYMYIDDQMDVDGSTRTGLTKVLKVCNGACRSSNSDTLEIPYCNQTSKDKNCMYSTRQFAKTIHETETSTAIDVSLIYSISSFCMT